MKTIIALSGLPGSGKTTFKNSDPLLKTLPFVDVADVYAEFNPISARDAFAELLNQTSEHLKGSDIVVIEASLARNTWQREVLANFCKMKHVSLKYKEFFVDAKTCYQRVLAQYNEVYPQAESDDKRAIINNYFSSRIAILNRNL